MKHIFWEVGAVLLLLFIVVSLYVWFPASRNQVQFGKTVVPTRLLQ